MPLAVGAKAPDVALIDTDRKKRNLSEFIKGKPAIVAFFPGAFTGVCTKEACSLRDTAAEFNQANAAVVGISVDSPWAQKGWSDVNKLNFPLLSDFKREAISKFGTNLPNFGTVEGYESTKRAVFVLDKDGTVRYSWVGDPPTEPPYEEIKQAVGKLK
jgi:peroxiredoxin